MNIISSILLSVLGLSVFSQPPLQEKRIVRSTSTQTFVVCYYSGGIYHNINTDFQITYDEPNPYSSSSDRFIYFDSWDNYDVGSRWIVYWGSNIFPMYYYKSGSSVMEPMDLVHDEISSWNFGAVSTTIEANPILRDIVILNKPSSEEKFKFGDTYQINYKKVPYYASDEISICSSNEEVAEVDSNGLVTFRPTAEFLRAPNLGAEIYISNGAFISDYCWFSLEEYPEHRIHLPTQTIFARGETFNHDGLKYEIYNSETGYSYFFESQLYVVTPNMNVEGWQLVDVYFEDPDVGQKWPDFVYQIYIHNPSINIDDDPFYHLLSIKINTEPNKVYFTESEEFTYEGLSIKAYFGDETHYWQEVYYSGFTVTHKDFDDNGIFTVTVAFHGKEAKYLVTVVDAMIECEVGEALPISIPSGYHFSTYEECKIHDDDPDNILSEPTDDGVFTALIAGQTYLWVSFDQDIGSGDIDKTYYVVIHDQGSGGGSGSDDGSGGGSGGEDQGGNGSSSNSENKQDNMLVGIIAGSAAAVIVAGALIIIITVSVKKKKAKNS